MTYTVIRSKNDWLSNYKGQTYNERLQEEISKSVFDEHSKYKEIYPLDSIIERMEFLTNSQKTLIMKNISDETKGVYEQLGKKSTVTCIDNQTNEILGIGASSLLLDEKSGKMIDNLILDNFGLWFSELFCAVNGGTNNNLTATDSSVTLFSIMGSNIKFNASGGSGHVIQMGSGTTAPARNDFVIHTALGTAPENAAINTNTGSYTVSNTIIYQADANPTGGSGTVNEIGSFGVWNNTGGIAKSVMIAHDAVTPAVNYVSGKLLRGSYTWQI